MERALHNAVRAPNAGFSQGWGFLVLDEPVDVRRFWELTTDPEDLARRLRQLAADPALRQRLGKAGAVRAQQYAPGGVAQKVLAIYEETMERRK